MNVNGRPGPAKLGSSGQNQSGCPGVATREFPPEWPSPCCSTADLLRVLARGCCCCGRRNGSLEVQVAPRLVVQGIDSASSREL